MPFHRLLALLFIGALASLATLSAAGRSEGSIQKTFDYPEGIHTIVVDADQQDIVLKAGGPRVTGRFIGDRGDEVKAVRNGDTLTITVRADRSWFSRRHQSARVELSVPKDLFLDLTTASGAILVQVTTAGLRARAASGDIEAPQGGTSAEVDSSSGTVRLSRFTGLVKASSLSGDLLLESISGDIQASTLSGSLRGKALAPADGSRFTAVSGDVELHLKEGPDGFRIRVETVSGDIKVGSQKADHHLESGSSGPVITAKAVSGDVRIE